MQKSPEIFGILNITTDSFSDGGCYLEVDKALAHADLLTKEGASVIDIGAASSHPDSQSVTVTQEMERLQEIIPMVQKKGISISIDSYNREIQLWAMQQNVDWLNDIHGFGDSSIYEQLSASDCHLIVMHAVQMTGAATRVSIAEDHIWDMIFRFFDERLNKLTHAGIARERLVLDTGMGYFLGNMPEASLAVLKDIDRLKCAFDLPVMISVSRKSFLRYLSGRSIADSDSITLAAELWAARAGVDYIRTHHVAQLHDALDLYRYLM